MFDQFRKPKPEDGIDDKIDQVKGLVDQVAALRDRFPAPRPELDDTEESIPFGSAPARRPAPASTHAPRQPDPVRTEPRQSRSVTAQAPAPVKPEPKRHVEREVFDQVLDAPTAARGRDASGSTQKFVLNTLQAGLNLTAIGWVLSPKGLGGYIAFKPLIGLVGVVFWTPGVLLGLTCFAVYARHVGRTRLFEAAWQVTLAFIVAKLIAVAFFGGAW